MRYLLASCYAALALGSSAPCSLSTTCLLKGLAVSPQALRWLRAPDDGVQGADHRLAECGCSTQSRSGEVPDAPNQQANL